MLTLKFGVDRSVQLEPALGGAIVAVGEPRELPLADPAAALTAALESPEKLPPLARCVVPGDRIAIALDDGVPCAAELVAAAVRYLLRVGIEAADIAIVRPYPAAGPNADTLRANWPADWKKHVGIEIHDPNDRQRLALLAGTAAGEPILLNRTLVDADLVLPIGCLHRPEAGYFGEHGVLYPAFSTTAAIQRFRSPGSLKETGEQKPKLDLEVDEVAGLLGVLFTIQAVPAGAGQVLHVLAGDVKAVRARGQEIYRAAWDCRAPQRAALVVAAIAGGPDQQTWSNLGRSLDLAQRLVADNGAIAVCCDLAEAPGAAVQSLAGQEVRKKAVHDIWKQREPDILPALQIARALDRGSVYLLSRLEASLVERLGFVAAAGPEEIARLAHHAASCIVVANAPYARVMIDEEGPGP